MERKSALSLEEQEQLISKLWVDKKGKKDTPSPHALYIALSTPRPNLSVITAETLAALAEDPFVAEYWAKTWGRVVVCVGPTGKSECLLADTREDISKRFIPVKTTQKLPEEELLNLVKVLPTGNLGEITLNNRSTTIEAFLISYIHLVDEFIWELYRSGIRPSYGQVTNLVCEEGFSVRLGSGHDILLNKVNNPTASVRLYGSGVNPDVSKVMGGIVFNQERAK
jgi:hypothetical protein